MLPYVCCPGGYPYRGKRFEEVLSGALIFGDAQMRQGCCHHRALIAFVEFVFLMHGRGYSRHLFFVTLFL